MTGLIVLIVLLWPMSLARADETVTVNFASIIGPVSYKGSGLFESVGLPSPWGGYPNYYVPDSVLSQLKLDTVKSMMMNSPEDPTTSPIYTRLVNLGVSFIIGTIDGRWNGCGESCAGGIPGGDPRWPLSRGWPCDDFNATTGACPLFESIVTQYFQADQANGLSNLAYDWWGEPDWTWKAPGGFTQFLRAWNAFYRTMKALKPSVKLLGPSSSEYFNGAWVHPFLDNAKTPSAVSGSSFAGTTTYPDFLNWHEFFLASDIQTHITNAVNYMASNEMPALSLAFDEYGIQHTLYRAMPGVSAKYLAVFERNPRLVKTNRSHWDYGQTPCDFVGNLTTGDCNYTPSPPWWVYMAYASMSGSIVTVTPGALGADATASIQPGVKAVVLLGRDDAGAAETVTVHMTNMSATGLVMDGQVHVNAFYIPNLGGAVAAPAPVDLLNQTVLVIGNTLDISLPNFGGSDAYQLILTPSSLNLSASLTWGAPIAGENVTSTTVYRALAACPFTGSLSLLASLGVTTQYSDTAIPPGTPGSSYEVTYSNANGESLHSNRVCKNFGGADTTPPAPPQGVQVR